MDLIIDLSTFLLNCTIWTSTVRLWEVTLSPQTWLKIWNTRMMNRTWWSKNWVQFTNKTSRTNLNFDLAWAKKKTQSWPEIGLASVCSAQSTQKAAISTSEWSGKGAKRMVWTFPFLKSLYKWKNYEVILAHHDIYVYPRISSETENLELKNHPKIHMIDAPVVEISSTFIRDNIKKGMNVQPLLPSKVWEYIDHNNFYRK